MRRHRTFALLAILVWCSALFAVDQRQTSIGVAARIDQLVLPGAELEAKPLDDRKSPIVLRIANVFPHGTSNRYDLVYYGLDPGTFDLKDYLRRKDGTSTTDLPAIKVEIKAMLPPGQVLPNPLESAAGPALGGYRFWLTVLAMAWTVGLVGILLVGRKKRQAAASTRGKGLTFAERLRPLVERASAGALITAERAELERLLLTFWQRRLGLEHAKPQEAFATMRQHVDAGPLLQKLEEWLHRPQSSGDIDVAKLLKPYADAPMPEVNGLSK